MIKELQDQAFQLSQSMSNKSLDHALQELAMKKIDREKLKMQKELQRQQIE